MKKTLLVALMVVAFTGVASASTLAVPFFNDSLNADGSGIGSTFIALHNNLTTAIDVGIYYFDNDGTETPPVGSNSFVLNGNTTLSFRPTVTDAASEGPGVDVPDKTGKRAGSMFIQWVGRPSDIQGRLHTESANGSQFSYLLPPGVSN